MSADVLVVDDDEDIRYFLRMGLSHEGYNVRCVASGQEALATSRQQKPDVMILDYMMPEMTGEELCNAVKHDPEFRDITIIMLSARSDLQTKLRCFDSGADEYLVKPVDPREIATRIERFLKLRPTSKTPTGDSQPSGLRWVSGKSNYGPYRVEGLIGRGGMGQVFKGIDPLLDRPVAIKVLSKQLSDSVQFVERFRREARLLASIDHPGIATIYTFGDSEDEHFFAMQWCAGGSMSEMLQEVKTIDVPIAVDYILQCAKALAAAAKKGIVHRDIKPSNLMFDEEGRIKLVDFGLAFSEKGFTHLTAVSEIVGTPTYMAPEQSKSQSVDFRSDIYALGITLYQMLYGKTPFSGSSAIDMVIKHSTEPFPPYDNFDGAIPRDLYAIIERMTQKDPSMRYQGYDALTRDLTEVQTSLHARRRVADAVTVFEKREVLLKEKKKFGDYALETAVGEDFLGKVYKGYDEKLQRFAAVRVLSKTYRNDQAFLKKLETRLGKLARLNHPGIGTIYDFGPDGDDYYLAQEWCSGGSVANLVRKKGRLGLDVSIPVLVQCIQVLASAQKIDVMHGNLRPTTILFDENQKIRIVDLGWSDAKPSASMHESGLHFMAPEWGNTSMDLRADIYSLGMIFYYMTYGIAPFSQSGIREFPQTLPLYDDLGGAIPQHAYIVMQKMSHPTTEERYPNYEALIQDLETLRPDRPAAVSISIPIAKDVSNQPTQTAETFFEILCKLFAPGESGVLVLRWSVLQVKFYLRHREIVLFESNQPGKNIWSSMARARFIQNTDVPKEGEDLEKTLKTFLGSSLFSIKDFSNTYQELMKQTIDEVFIWPQCEAAFFPATIQNTAFTTVRASDVLLEAARSSLDESLVTNRWRNDSLIRRTPLFEQLLSSFNLGPEESFLAYRVEGEGTSLETLQVLTGFPQGKVLLFVYLLEQIGAIEVRSPERAAKKKEPDSQFRKEVDRQYRKEFVPSMTPIKKAPPAATPPPAAAPKPAPPVNVAPSKPVSPPPAPITQPFKAVPVIEKNATAPAGAPKPAPVEPAKPKKLSFEEAVVRVDVPKSQAEIQEENRRKVAEQFYRKAQIKFELGDYWHAAHLCQQAIDNHREGKYFFLQADSFAQHPRFQKDAEEAYHHAIRMMPYNADYHSQLAAFYVERKLLLRARTHCDKSLALIADQEQAKEIKALLEKQKLGPGGCWCVNDEE